MSSIIQDSLNEIKDILQAEPFFSNVPVVVENPETPSTLVSISQLRQSLGVAIFLPNLDVMNADAAEVHYEDLIYPIHCISRPRLNTTGKSALEILENVNAALQNAVPAMHTNAYFVRNPKKRIEDRTAVIFETQISTKFTTALTRPQVANISITPGSGVAPRSVSMTCATAGAAIFYTTNGNFPSPQVGTLYTAPFNVNAAATVRAVAYLAGYLNSNMATATFS